jgi:hypothetical protein
MKYLLNIRADPGRQANDGMARRSSAEVRATVSKGNRVAANRQTWSHARRESSLTGIACRKCASD